MTKEESLGITAHIGKVIAENTPRIAYSPSDLKKAREGYSEKKLQELEEEGFYFGDFELFYIMLRFADGMDLWNRADEAFLKKLFSEAKKFDREAFYADPYLSTVKISEKRIGNFLLTESEYAQGEFFQYDMPSLSDEIVVPKIGFFPQKVAFPAVYEGKIPWVSVCPSEIFSMTPDTEPARGNCLVLGLGLGYYPFLISAKKEVDHVTIIEKSPEIIELFEKEILPHFPQKEKISVVQDDAFHYLSDTENGKFDFCYADIWEGWADGAEAVEKIEPYEKKLYETEFRYWIKKEIDWYRKHRENA